MTTASPGNWIEKAPPLSYPHSENLEMEPRNARFNKPSRRFDVLSNVRTTGIVHAD